MSVEYKTAKQKGKNIFFPKLNIHKIVAAYVAISSRRLPWIARVMESRMSWLVRDFKIFNYVPSAHGIVSLPRGNDSVTVSLTSAHSYAVHRTFIPIFTILGSRRDRIISISFYRWENWHSHYGILFKMLWNSIVQESDCLSALVWVSIDNLYVQVVVTGIMKSGPKSLCHEAENRRSSSELLARGPPSLAVCDSLVLKVAKIQVM